MNEEQAADINQNSFDELMVGDEEQLASTCKTRLRNNKKIDNDYNGEKPDSQDEWADITFSEGEEEDDTSEESSNEEGNKQEKGEMAATSEGEEEDDTSEESSNEEGNKQEKGEMAATSNKKTSMGLIKELEIKLELTPTKIKRVG
ncbi:hypothetical protein KY285_017899 [Solanum tuberosum]|nr:hypothetical protein KY289_018054 [Solanum tuberosum]KAH0703621.1 hypothetical protein KY285_017899 [Solanum tuberosum]